MGVGDSGTLLSPMGKGNQRHWNTEIYFLDLMLPCYLLHLWRWYERFSELTGTCMLHEGFLSYHMWHTCKLCTWNIQMFPNLHEMAIVSEVSWKPHVPICLACGLPVHGDITPEDAYYFRNVIHFNYVVAFLKMVCSSLLSVVFPSDQTWQPHPFQENKITVFFLGGGNMTSP